MGSITTFRDLNVWQEAHKFVLLVYEITQKFPTEEKYGLVSQIRRSSVSVASNIVEGFKRRSKNDSVHFYIMAESSLEECRYQLLLSHDLKYLSAFNFERLEQQAIKVARMLYRFKESQK